MSSADTLVEHIVSISPELTVHEVADDRILLLGEQRSFALAGSLYVRLARAMDGRHTRRQIVGRLAQTYGPELVEAAITHMMHRGYARLVVPDAPRHRQSFWVEMEHDPVQVESVLEKVRFRVLPAGDVPEVSGQAGGEKLSTLLERSGLRCFDDVAEHHVTVVLVDDYLSPNLARIAADIEQNGGRWLPLKPAGRQIWMGPVFGPNDSTCLTCLHRCMAGNRPGDDHIASTDRPLRPATSHLPASIEMAFGFAAMELSRLAMGDETLTDGILSYDVGTRRADVHRVRMRHDCPCCSPRNDGCETPADPERCARISLSPTATTVSGGGWRSLSTEAALSRLEPLISPITGIVPDLTDISVSPELPVFAAVQVLAGHLDPRQNRTMGKPNGAAGKGATVTEARVSCLAEAVERYSCGFTGSEPRRRARFDELDGTALHPHTLLNYSDRQYASRGQTNETCDRFAWVAEPFDEAAAIDWTPAWSYRFDAVRWLPTRFCYFNYFDQEAADSRDENVFCRADSNGCAAGSTLEEAVLQGALELVERDAVALWWYNRIARPAFDAAGFDDPLTERTQEHLRRNGRQMRLLDLTTDVGIPVCAAVSARDDGRRIVLGLGAHLDARIAIRRAVAEHNQMAVYEPVGGAADIGRDGRKWLQEASLETDAFLVPDGQVAVPAALEPPRNLADAAEQCLRRIGKVADDVIILDTSRRELDFSCARVTAPGLRHFWPRLAPGRLYDGPVASGWTNHALTEDDMNPIPFFL